MPDYMQGLYIEGFVFAVHHNSLRRQICQICIVEGLIIENHEDLKEFQEQSSWHFDMLWGDMSCSWGCNGFYVDGKECPHLWVFRKELICVWRIGVIKIHCQWDVWVLNFSSNFPRQICERKGRFLVLLLWGGCVNCHNKINGSKKKKPKGSYSLKSIN